MKRKIKISLTRAQAEGLMDAGNRGVADLHDGQEDQGLLAADAADEALNLLGTAMRDAEWTDEFTFPTEQEQF